MFKLPFCGASIHNALRFHYRNYRYFLKNGLYTESKNYENTPIDPYFAHGYPEFAAYYFARRKEIENPHAKG